MEDANFLNSDTHKTQFITIMKDIYEIYLITWERVSIVDNTNANLNTARLLKMPHVGYCNHKFNLDMKSVIEKTKSLDNTIYDIKQTMIQAKEMKNSAVLRTLTGLQPEIHNETRWSSKCKMLKKVDSNQE